jgi:hypothetical protein
VNWKERAASAMLDAAAFGDGVAVTCGVLHEEAPAIIAGAASFALRITARCLQGRGRP